MILKSVKNRVALVIAVGLFSNCYPLSERAALSWAILAGAGVGVPTGLGAGYLATKAPFNRPEAVYGLGFVAGAGAGLLSAAVLYNILYRYTPKPTIHHAKKTIQQISKDSKYAQDFLVLSREALLRQLLAIFGPKAGAGDILGQFSNFRKDLEAIVSRLDSIKDDLDGDYLSKKYESVHDLAIRLDKYLSIRFVLMTLAIASEDILLKRKFSDYKEFGTNGCPDFSGAIGHISMLSRHLNDAESALGRLIATQSNNIELSALQCSLGELLESIRFLKSVATLRSVQVEIFLKEKNFAMDQVLGKRFRDEYDLSYTLNAHSLTSWPLVTAKQKLNVELSGLQDFYQKACNITALFNQNQSEHARQSLELLNKIQMLITLVETDLQFIAKSKDYAYQVGLYEEYLERERQRRFEQERFERQQALERERLEEENRHHQQKLRQERELAREKQRQEDKKAEKRKKHERELLDKKLAHEKEMQKAKLNQKNKDLQAQATCTPPSAYNPYANASAPAYEAPQNYDPDYVKPSAPPAPASDQPPSYEELFPTPPAYNPYANVSPPAYEAPQNYDPDYVKPSAPTAELDSPNCPPPSYESLFPTK